MRRQGWFLLLATALVTLGGARCGKDDPRRLDTRAYRFYVVPPTASGLPPQWSDSALPARVDTTAPPVRLGPANVAGVVVPDSGAADWSSAEVRAYLAGTAQVVARTATDAGNRYALRLDPSQTYDLMVVPQGGTHPPQVCVQGCAAVRPPTTAQTLTLGFGRDVYGDGAYPVAALNTKTNTTVPLSARIDVYEWPGDAASAGRFVTSVRSRSDGTYDVWLAPPTAEYRLRIVPDPSAQMPAQWGNFDTTGGTLPSFRFDPSIVTPVRSPLHTLSAGFLVPGTVQDFSGNAVPSVLTAVDAASGLSTAVTTTSSTGAFRIDLPAGAYQVAVDPLATGPLAIPSQTLRTITVGTDGTTNLSQVVLNPGKLLLLELQGEDGSAMPTAADLTILSTEWDALRAMEVPAGGVGKLMVLPGPSRVLADAVPVAAPPPAPPAGCPARGLVPLVYRPAQEIAGPPMGGDTEARFTLRAGVTLNGWILAPSGAPVVCARVVVVPDVLAAEVPGPILSDFAGAAGLMPGAQVAYTDDTGGFSVVLPPTSFSQAFVDALTERLTAPGP